MKILYITTIGITMNFFNSLVEKIVKDGNLVDIATNDIISPIDIYFNNLGCGTFTIPWSRSPFDINNIKAFKQIKRLLSEGKYDIVHCHTPIASACTRIACRKLRKKGLKVIYTAHGFHFFKGAPLKNWLIYYPIEWLCSFWTDTIITINQEDYCRAKKHFHSRDIKYVPGVGIDFNKFARCECDRKQKREELGLSENDFAVLSVGELSTRKNHQIVIKAINEISDSRCKYFIVGSGPLLDELKELIFNLQLEKRIFLLGQRSDISDLLSCSDLFILPSLQEGLPVALMEAIASKTPVLCSNIRGDIELVDPAQTFSPNSVEEVKKLIISSMKNKEQLKEQFVDRNFKNLSKFSLENINKNMMQIYMDTLS